MTNFIPEIADGWLPSQGVLRMDGVCCRLHPEGRVIDLSRALYQAMGEPARVMVLYHPGRRQIAFRPAHEGEGGYPALMHSADSKVRIFAASVLRANLAAHGVCWVSTRIVLPIFFRKSLWVVELPSPSVPEAADAMMRAEEHV